MPLPRAKVVRPSRPRRPKASEWVLLEQRIDQLAGDWCYGDILNLPGWKVLKYKELSHDIVIMAELDTPYANCCACPTTESELKKSGLTNPHHVQDLPIRCKRVRIYYRLQRQFCKRCRKSAQQLATGVDDVRRMTTRLIAYAEQESFNLFRSFSDEADEIGCSEQTIRNIFTKRATELEDESQRMWKEKLYEPPAWLAIDEVHPQKNVEYCVISSPMHRQVIDLLPVNQDKELFKWLLRLPNSHLVKVVTMDMCLEYRKLVMRLLPQAKIVVDRYHVHNLLNVALKGVLDIVRISMTYSECREYMRPEYLLLTSYRKLSTEENKDKHGIKQPSDKEQADKWLADVPDIARAHRLKEDFSDILQLTDREKAEELTNAWLPQVCGFVEYFQGKYKKKHHGAWTDPFGNIPHTITDWRVSILNYIDCKSMFGSRTISNFFAENVNGRIKEAYRLGHHYSFEVLRLKCIYGGVVVRRRPPHPLDGPQLRLVRRRQSGGNATQKPDLTSNLEILKQARVAADDTRGLLPQPKENAEWASRFNLEYMEKARQIETSSEPLHQALPTSEREKVGDIPMACNERKRRIKYNPDQGRLF